MVGSFSWHWCPVVQSTNTKTFCDLFWTTNYTVTHVNAIFQEQQYVPIRLYWMKIYWMFNRRPHSFYLFGQPLPSLHYFAYITSDVHHSQPIFSLKAHMQASPEGNIFWIWLMDWMKGDEWWLRHIKQPMPGIFKNGVTCTRICSASLVWFGVQVWKSCLWPYISILWRSNVFRSRDKNAAKSARSQSSPDTDTN